MKWGTLIVFNGTIVFNVTPICDVGEVYSFYNFCQKIIVLGYLLYICRNVYDKTLLMEDVFYQNV